MTTNTTTIDLFTELLDRICAGGDDLSASRASRIHQVLKSASSAGHLDALPPASDFDLFVFPRGADLMKSCKFISELCMVLVAPTSMIPACIAWNLRQEEFAPKGHECIPKYADIKDSRPASLSRALTLAKKTGEKGSTTLLAVNMVDVEMIMRGEGKKAGGTSGLMSFAHSFVMFVSPNGVRVIQAWGEHGYTLRENVESPQSRRMTFAEATAFALDYDKLCGMKGVWDAKINKLYLRLFNVDVNKITNPTGPEMRQISPKFTAWTRIKTIPDVQVADMHRWLAVLDVLDRVVGFGRDI
ncbi:hypothetical protein B0H14DRAFT_2464837 [Mycena olivaceomarginata]|nr:hypothetical protein B0H14DRAFT_2464837 [Mycena olivaceomarginata]